jgi:hypothetical protein
MSQERRVTLKIDLNAGTIEIDAPSDDFNNTIEKTMELAEAINLGKKPLSQGPAVSGTASESARTESVSSESSGEPVIRTRVRVKAGASPSSARSGRIGSFEPVDLGLTEDQERQLRNFMETKQPKDHIPQVAVSLYQGEKILGRKSFNYNEIYTLMRLSGIKDLPKALDVTIKRMIDDSFVIKDGLGFALKFVGRDFVEKLESGNGDEK